MARWQDEEFARDVAERRRYPEPHPWYLAFDLDPAFSVDDAHAALETCDVVRAVRIGEAPGMRPRVVVHVDARSQDEVLRAPYLAITDALLAAAPPRFLRGTGMIAVSVIGPHEGPDWSSMSIAARPVAGRGWPASR
ncbi:MAG: hypothetical protein M0P31_13555 [Solirubrobacteraceae bacterium]|nr:hypothetical protein [Solirubrobacteraceae bacterium]